MLPFEQLLCNSQTISGHFFPFIDRNIYKSMSCLVTSHLYSCYFSIARKIDGVFGPLCLAVWIYKKKIIHIILFTNSKNMCKFVCTCASCVNIAFLVSVVKNIKVTKHSNKSSLLLSQTIVEVILKAYIRTVSS